MAPEDFKRKLTAILSADVEGYSRLMGEDEDATIRTLTTYRKLMSTLIQKRQGRVVDSPGDNLLAEFGSVVDAVRCAVEIQEELRIRNAELPENRQMAFRIGINLGDVVEEEERIYGDGVNIAARVEGLAEGGGICISGTVYDSIKNKLSLSYESMGEHTVKNITDPVRVYRMRVGPEAEAQKKAGPKRWRRAALAGVAVLILVIAAAAIWNFYLRRPSVEAADPKKMAFPLPEKPSIAVLPFDNMSGDPDQEYIADGISENIIATLSKVSSMFVIARNSTFTYKGKPVKVRQVAEELGVRYVLEGSVQKSGDRLRVTAQLIDAINGHHLWSEKYDRKMRDFFDLQDEITKKIVVELRVEVGSGEQARIESKSTDNFEAWTNVAKGAKLFAKFNKEDNIKARALFEAAIKLDPGYAIAWAWLVRSHTVAATQGWSESRAASLKLALEFAQKALALDDKSPGVHHSLGVLYAARRQLEKAISEFKIAISLDPNFRPGYALLARVMFDMGEFEESITLMKKAMRLSPYYYPPWYLRILCNAYFFTERYDEAIAGYNQYIDRCRRGECATWRALSGLARVNAELGKLEEARAYMAEALEINPKLSLAFYKRRNRFKDPAHLQRMLDALSKAGLK